MTSPTPESASATESTLTRPADAARQLGIPASTLRRWSRRFAPFLSPEANGAARENGSRGHRRYTPQDLEVLARCKALLSEGRTFEQAAQELERAYQPSVQAVEGEIEEDEAEPPTPEAVLTDDEPLEMVREEDAVDVGQMMAQLLSSLSGSQQMIITGQQSERELLGVVLQDNFNLKEENKKLRERMVETERRIFEMNREIEKARTQERERMRQMEAYLFQLQRQMDDLVRRSPAQPAAPARVTVSPQPAAPAPTPKPAPEPPTPEGTSAPSLPADASPHPAPSPRKKRSFWDWLLGREASK